MYQISTTDGFLELRTHGCNVVYLDIKGKLKKAKHKLSSEGRQSTACPGKSFRKERDRQGRIR